MKTFSLELENGEPASRRRLETRLLHYRKMPGNDEEYGDQFWYGYTYVWNDEQTDAELARGRRASTARSRSTTPQLPAASASRPGTSPAGPNAPCATRWRPSTSWASTRCR